jgi:hypothetical protein
MNLALRCRLQQIFVQLTEIEKGKQTQNSRAPVVEEEETMTDL